MKYSSDFLFITLVAIYLLVGFFLLDANAVECGKYADCRYQGAPLRNADNSIHRDPKVIAAYRKLHPCPSTGLHTGACEGWQIDHVMPLANGYCDCVFNMQWLPSVLKSGKGIYPKDRWERKINGTPMILVPMPVQPLNLMAVP